MFGILLIILSFNTKIVPVSQSHRDIIEMILQTLILILNITEKERVSK
jgi:hypothetical protein